MFRSLLCRRRRDPVQLHPDGSYAIAGRLDRDADWIAAGIGRIDLLDGVDPGHLVANGNHRARELRKIEHPSERTDCN